MAGDAQRIGIYGFGAAAHIAAQVARHQRRTVFALTRSGDHAAQQLALRLGAASAASSDEMPPDQLDAALLFAPVGALVARALQAVVKGGVVVCGGIHMSDIPAFAYALPWGERRVVSVANLTRDDGLAFMRIAAETRLAIETTTYPLAQASARAGQASAQRSTRWQVTGAAVVVVR